MVHLGEVGDNTAKIPSSAFYVEHAAPAEAAAGIANGGHRAQNNMLAGDLLKAEHVSLDVGTQAQLMEDVPAEKRLTLSFPHISAWVPDLFGPGAPQGGNVFTNTLKKLKGGKAKGAKAKERQVGAYADYSMPLLCKKSAALVFDAISLSLLTCAASWPGISSILASLCLGRILLCERTPAYTALSCIHTAHRARHALWLCCSLCIRNGFAAADSIQHLWDVPSWRGAGSHGSLRLRQDHPPQHPRWQRTHVSTRMHACTRADQGVKPDVAVARIVST